MRIACLFGTLGAILMAGCGPRAATPASPDGPAAAPLDDDAVNAVSAALIAKFGDAHAERIRRGVRQVADRWWPEDGSAADLQAFAEEHFLIDDDALEQTFRHFEYAFEMLDGHLNEIDIELSRYQDLDEGGMQPLDGLLAAFAPFAHLDDDLFGSKIAFVALLNFPLTTLEQRVSEGASWPRDQWARARLVGAFQYRVPAPVIQQIERAGAAADRYIDGYNIRMDRLCRGGERAGFADGLSLISHWGLREEIRAQYGQEGGLDRQRVVQKVMERIIRQEIPAEVVDSDALEWDPETNLVRTPGESAWREAAREPDTRYEMLLGVFRGRKAADPFFPELPTHVLRSFELDREMPEARLRAMLEQVLGSPVVARIAGIVTEKLGRPLEPFDLWFTGFRPSAELNEDELSAATRQRYPTPDAFRADLPRMLGELGFSAETAAFLAERIRVEPSRGPGEAVGAMLRDGHARLRTRVGADGMDYKGFNIAVHEMGHTVEQTFSVGRIDHTLLQGVPNTGFTEAFAFLFQSRDLQLLGVTPPEGFNAEALRHVDRLWDAFEIAGVAMLDIGIWHWMYDHPDATATQAREAMVRIATEIWDRWYAPVFGVSGSPILAIYSHIIAYGLYTPDYPLGMFITAQVERFLQSRNLGEEMERMCRLGRIAPDVWMQEAVGSPVSADATIENAAAALDAGI